ncbi:hypothetical protein PC117_g5841 [Phytophthora cactorum]|uniref:Uncharacterized protein n=3 Tax=Phytophthora cactorum TaxID=29920 RepID=A0A8T1E6H3_9STRA|nr:hypothetical protein PC117_g5841 [Phytophthora cactorum]
MAEAPPDQKRKLDEPPGARKRRRVRSSVEGASAETARSLGGVAAVKDVSCLDSRYKYIRPGGRHDGEERADYLLGELAVIRYIEDMRVVAAEQAAQVSGKAEGAADFGNVSGAVDQAADVEPNEKGDRDEEAARASGAAGIVGHGGEDGDDVGAGYDDAAGHIAVAGRGAQGGSGGRTTRRVASTASAEGDEVDSSEVGFDMDVGMDVDGAAGQACNSHGETGAATTPSYTPPIMLQDVYVSKLVAFSPDKERWMKAKIYRPIGTAYIIERVYRLVKKGKKASLFQIRWLDSQFQSAVEHISVGVVQLGIKNYVALTRVKNPDWRILVRPDPTDEIDFEEDDSDCEEEVLQAFDPSELLPTSLAEVEAIKSMRFDPNGEVEGPSYLYQHSDGSAAT